MENLTGEYRGRYGIKTSKGFKPALELSTESNTVKMVKEIQQAIDRLAAYESYGLGPEELRQIDGFYLEKCQEIKELKEKELPLYPGDAVYQILIRPKDRKYIICQAEVIQVIKSKTELSFYTQLTDEKGNTQSYEFLQNAIGNTVFFKQEEAEKKVEEMEKNDKTNI